MQVSRGCLAGTWPAHALTPACLWAPSLSRIMWMASPLSTSQSMVRRNLRNSVLRCRGRQRPITVPVSTSSAANRVVTVSTPVAGARPDQTDHSTSRRAGAKPR